MGAAAMAVVQPNGGGMDDEDEFKYNYNNPLDSSHFVPNMMDGADDNGGINNFDFNLNGYDLIDVDQSKKLNVIQVEYATNWPKICRINISLTRRMWKGIAIGIIKLMRI